VVATRPRKWERVCKEVSDSEGAPLGGRADDMAFVVACSGTLNRRIVEF
jgi:hypothetical protein